MALFVNQNESRSELQKRIAAELQERSKQRAEQADLPDGVEDSKYIENTAKTTVNGWVWIVVIAVIVLAAFIAIVNTIV